MRNDGTITYYEVQANIGGTPSEKLWTGVNIGSVLFSNMPYAQRQGVEGDAARAILAKQDASTSLWQHYGIHGFAERADALAALDACRGARGGRSYKFRVVRRSISQITVALSA